LKTEGLKAERPALLERSLRFLGSVRFTVLVLVLSALFMGLGSLLESSGGRATAFRYVYASAWFRALLFLIGVNIACAVTARWPLSRRQIPFALSHAGILLLLFAAWMSQSLGVEAELELGLGVDSQHAQSARRSANEATAPERVKLPFHVRLITAERRFLPGTQRASALRCTLALTDEAGQIHEAKLSNNHPFDHAGFRLFLQDVDEGAPSGTSVRLRVAKDPGYLLFLAGFAVLQLGIVGWLFQSRTRRSAQSPAADPSQQQAASQIRSTHTLEGFEAQAELPRRSATC